MVTLADGNMQTDPVGGRLGCFDVLPEDVILSILHRIDFKTLCQILLVSKNFASIIYHIQTLSVTLSTNDDGGEECSSGDICAILYSTIEEIPHVLQQSSVKGFKFCRSLEKFKDLRYIHVEFDSPTMAYHYSPFRWKLVCRSSGSVVKSLISVLPEALLKKKITERFGVQEENPIVFRGKSGVGSGGRMSGDQARHFAEWISVLFLLIKCHGSLESVTIADSRCDDGVFMLRDEQLVEWRNVLLYKDFPTNVKCRIIGLSDIHLPESGYRMKNSLAMVMGVRVESNHDDDASATEYDDVMTWQYDVEKEVLREAVTELIKECQQLL